MGVYESFIAKVELSEAILRYAKSLPLPYLMRNIHFPRVSITLWRAGVATVIAMSLGLVVLVIGQGFSSISGVRALEKIALGLILIAAR